MNRLSLSERVELFLTSELKSALLLHVIFDVPHIYEAHAVGVLPAVVEIR